MSKPQLPLTTNERVHTGNSPSSSHDDKSECHLPTDDETRLSLRSRLMGWAETTPRGAVKNQAHPAFDHNPTTEDSFVFERPKGTAPSTDESVPVYRVKREPPPSTLSRLRAAATDACITLGGCCQRGVEWCSEQFSTASRAVRSIASLFWKQTETSAVQREQKSPLATLTEFLRGAWFAPSPTPEATVQTVVSKENEQRSRGLASPAASVNITEATTAVKDAILAFAEALRTTEKKRTDDRAAAIEAHRKDLERAIEHLKSHDCGPTNPILRNLIIAMSSDYAAMPLEVAEELLRIAELKEQEQQAGTTHDTTTT